MEIETVFSAVVLLVAENDADMRVDNPDDSICCLHCCRHGKQQLSVQDAVSVRGQELGHPDGTSPAHADPKRNYTTCRSIWSTDLPRTSRWRDGLLLTVSSSQVIKARGVCVGFPAHRRQREACDGIVQGLDRLEHN